MSKESKENAAAPGLAQGARSATEAKPGAGADFKRWSAGRKREVVLRLLRGESVDALSREVGEPTYKLEQWRDRALAGLEAGLKQRESDPVERELDEAKRRIGELVMEVEILQKERQRQGLRPLALRMSSK